MLSPRLGLSGAQELEPENSREFDPFRVLFTVSVWCEAIVIGITAIVVLVEHVLTPDHDSHENHQAIAAGAFTAVICVSYVSGLSDFGVRIL
jgi:hypothetical protein